MKNKKKLSLKKMKVTQLNNVRGGNVYTQTRPGITELTDSLRFDCFPSGLTYKFCDDKTVPVTNPTIC
ncbi:hypothetical protein M0D21_21485 [Aquimarina sp. D1M17]|uniref:hypothetical protein n=1 Tax=Aquimarina acroporae TaxID=2937283 RepID=UPI0020C033B4|nr:hypothetical protein [Aquimarina acroporae]MCK8524165.1 hypothetical protein [Aquimarina acroporae]